MYGILKWAPHSHLYTISTVAIGTHSRSVQRNGWEVVTFITVLFLKSGIRAPLVKLFPEFLTRFFYCLLLILLYLGRIFTLYFCFNERNRKNIKI